jgi:hypothetical protein
MVSTKKQSVQLITLPSSYRDDSLPLVDAVPSDHTGVPAISLINSLTGTGLNLALLRSNDTDPIRLLSARRVSSNANMRPFRSQWWPYVPHFPNLSLSSLPTKCIYMSFMLFRIKRSYSEKATPLLVEDKATFQNTQVVFERTKIREWLCWRRPAAIYSKPEPKT